ncbi:AbiTii domain-containing protein [Aeromonas hydrophila]|uniref:AbiTii domain-containing protein n=1 Tax=Aeromonas hydrophila TaxID=644 RepID=UPI000AA9D876|nr:hypothetical protein [Aeromonas hydrophila]
MPALIPELIAMASDPSVKASDLLRRAMVAARLLRLPEWATWISHELQGYPDGTDLPSYRLLHGELKVMNPVRGLIPFQIDDAELTDMLSEARFYQPISTLEELAVPGKMVRYFFSSEQTMLIMREMQLEMVPEVSLGANQVRGLIEAVRDKVLIWALDLAESGIQGEGMSFTRQEQQQAQQPATTHIHITGDITNSQILAGSPGAKQQQTVDQEDKMLALNELLPWLERVVEEGRLRGCELEELRTDLATLQAQAVSPNPKWPVIRMVASSVQAILEGATGGVLAGQALTWLTTIMAE